MQDSSHPIVQNNSHSSGSPTAAAVLLVSHRERRGNTECVAHGMGGISSACGLCPKCPESSVVAPPTFSALARSSLSGLHSSLRPVRDALRTYAHRAFRSSLPPHSSYAPAGAVHSSHSFPLIRAIALRIRRYAHPTNATPFDNGPPLTPRTWAQRHSLAQLRRLISAAYASLLRLTLHTRAFYRP